MAGRPKKKLARYVAVAFGGIALVILLAIGFVMFVALGDREEVPQLIEETVREHTGGEIVFAHYHFNALRNFPYLTLVVEDIQVHDPGFAQYHQELLRADALAIQFRFWKLFRRELAVHSITLQDGAAHLFRNTDGTYMNTSFLKGDEQPKPPKDSTGKHMVFSLEQVQLKNFSFQFLDSLRRKSYHIDFVNTRFDFSDQGPISLIDVTGQWYFHGLTFKFRNGPFMQDQRVKVDWRLTWDHERDRIDIGPATMRAEGERFDLGGYVALGDPAHLRLEIGSEGIMLDKARAVIAPNISEALSSISIDQPIQAKAIVDGPLIPGQPAPVDVFFSLRDAVIGQGNMQGTDTYLEGHFYNCDRNGPVNPHSGCLSIDTLYTRLFDAVPVTAGVLVKDLKDPTLEVDMQVDMPLADLNPLLPPGKFRFQKGTMALQLTQEGSLERLTQPNSKAALPNVDGQLAIRGATLTFPGQGGMTLEGLETDLTFNQEDVYIQNQTARMSESSMRLSGSIENVIPFLLDRSQQVQADLELEAGMLDLDDIFPPAAEPSGKKQSQTTNRKPIAINPITEAMEDLLAAINVRWDITLDSMTVRDYTASDIKMRAELLSFCEQGATSNCILIDTLTGRMYDDVPFAASLRLTDLANPHIEMAMQLSSSVAPFRDMLPPDKLLLRAGTVDVAFRYDGTLDDYFGISQIMDHPDLEGTIVLQDVDVDYLGDQYAVRDMDTEIMLNEDDLVLRTAQFSLNGNTISMEGRFDGITPFLFTSTDELTASLDIQSPLLDLNRLPARVARNEVTVEAAPKPTVITKKITKAINELEAALQIQTDEIRYRAFRATDVNMFAQYLTACGEAGPGARCIRVDTFQAKLFGNAPVQATIQVEQLHDPLITADFKLDGPLADLNALFPPEQIRFNQGTMALAFQYQGQPHDDFDVDEDIVKASLTGEAELNDASFTYFARGYQFDAVDASLQFNNKDLVVDKLGLVLNDNTLSLEGRFYNLLPYLFVPNRTLQATLDISSPRFSLNTFAPPAKVQAASTPRAGDHDPNPLKGTLDSLLNHLRVNFRLQIDEFLYKEFAATELNGDVHLDRDQLNINNASMIMGDGSFRLQGDILGIANHQPEIDISANIAQADMAKAMTHFNNFGLPDVSADNVQGILHSDISFRARADENYELDPSSMESSINLKLEEGALVNFPVLRDIKGFLLKNRHFDDVQFATLEKTFRLQDQKILIDDLQVISSALAFSVDGVYDLRGEQRTDLLFEIPLDNLVDFGLSEEAMKHYQESKHGPSILLAVDRKDEELRIRPVLSRRKHKEIGKN